VSLPCLCGCTKLPVVAGTEGVQLPACPQGRPESRPDSPPPPAGSAVAAESITTKTIGIKRVEFLEFCRRTQAAPSDNYSGRQWLSCQWQSGLRDQDSGAGPSRRCLHASPSCTVCTKLSEACQAVVMAVVNPFPYSFAPSARCGLWALASTLLVAVLAPPVAGLTFYLPSGGRRCFVDAIAPNTRVFGEVFVTASQGEMPVDVHVTHVATQALMYKRENVAHVKFGFTTPSGYGAAGHAAPRVIDGQAAEAARASRAGGGGGTGGGAAPGVGDGGGADRHGRSLQSVSEAEAKGAMAGGDAWGDQDLAGLDEDDWADPEGDAPPPGIDGSYGDDEGLWSTARYEVCVSHNGATQPVTGVFRRVRLTLASGSGAHDFGRLALKQHLGHLELALHETVSELEGLHLRMDEVRRREDSLYHMNAATGVVVVRAGTLCVFVLALVAVLQGWAVRRHLNKKKVL